MATRIVTSALALVMCVAAAGLAEAAIKQVSMRGTDSSVCGTSAARCRTIGQAIANAHQGDTVLVEPGVYGDTNNDGDFDDPGEEFAGNQSVVYVNKAVTILSTAGAPATMISAGGTNSHAVNIVVSGAVFGARNQGFTLTGAGSDQFAAWWALLMGNGVRAVVGGNVARGFHGFGAFGSEGSLLKGNRASGNGTGYGFWVNCTCSVVENTSTDYSVAFYATARAPQFTGNVASGSSAGFDLVNVDGAVLFSNTAVGNEAGFALYSTTGPVIWATYNAAVGNLRTAFYVGTTGVTVRYNNIYGTVENIGLQNASAGVVNATRNYWGASTGPGADTADEVSNTGAGTTTTTPFRAHPVIVPITAK